MKNLTAILTLIIGTLTSFSQSLNDSLLIHYSFNGNSLDQSGNGYDGTVNATLTQDQFGNPNSAYSFNGISEYIDLPNVAELKPQLPISYSVWVKFNSLPATGNVMFTNNFAQDNHSGVWMQAASTGELAIAYGSALGGSSGNNIRLKKGTTILQTGVWYHVVGVVRSETDMDLYIDCVDDGGTYSGNSTSPLAYTSDAGSIGRKDNAGTAPYYFDGVLDEFSYWNRSLNPSDVQQLCNSFASVEEANDEISFTVSPNPSAEHITISSDFTQAKRAQIIDTEGREILSSEELTLIDVSNISSGIYFIQLIDGNDNILASRKFIIH